MATRYSAGRTGFTGTSLVIDPTTQSFVILRTNHVHPNRNWGLTNAQRRDVADAISRGVAVRPTPGSQTDWYGGMADKTSATLPLSGPVQRRWRYTTDPLYHCRGDYVDGVRVSAGRRVVFDDRVPAQAALFAAVGWVRSRD